MCWRGVGNCKHDHGGVRAAILGGWPRAQLGGLRPLDWPECSSIMQEDCMPWRVEYTPETRVVVITGSGEIHNEDATAQAGEAIRLLQQNEARIVLVDYSDALSEVSLPSLYGLPDYCSQIGAPWNARIALVVPRTRYRIESYHFFETVCKNAGYNIRLFDAREAAEQWLAQTRPAQEPAVHP